MSVCAYFDCTSASLSLSGKRSQENGILTCQAAPGNASWRSIEGLSQRVRSSYVSFSDRHIWTPSEHIPAMHKRHRYKSRVAADYPDSKPDASYLGDLGYHPLEDVSSLEKEPSIDLTEQRLTEAEIARTIAEANGTAILFATLWDDQNHIFGTEVEYIIDDRGDIYFQIDSDSEFLTTLKKAGTKMNVAIGYESIDTWIMEQQEVRDNPIPEEPHEEMSDDEDDDEDDDDDDDNEDSWSIITADGTEYVLDAIIGEKESPEESIGDWSGLDTLASVHPLEFASALATAALADDNTKIEKPSQNLRIVGDVQRLTIEEEQYLRKLCADRFVNDADEVEGDDNEDEEEEEEGDDDDDEDDDEDEEDDDKQGIDIQAISGTPIVLVEEIEIDENEEGSTGNDAATSFYKLEIESIHVISYFRTESSVEPSKFQAAKPDILAHASVEMVERLNDRGKVLEDALKLVCLHQRGLEVEEAALLHIDSLGMDLRVHCGREVKTVRISFSKRATSVEHAEQLLNQLLYPQIPLRGHKQQRVWPWGKSV